MLRLPALLLLVLLQPQPLPALAPEPAAQDVSLGLVSGVPGLRDLQGRGQREAGAGRPGQAAGRFKCPRSDWLGLGAGNRVVRNVRFATGI